VGYVHPSLLSIMYTYGLIGRRVGMMISAMIIVVGTIIQATSTNLTGFMIGRFILGFGASLNITAGSSYASEIAHPVYRGFMTSLYMVLWFFGGIPAAFICWKTSKIQGTLSWRLPIWLQIIFPCMVLMVCMLLPEV
jgi:MFS family permease